MVKSARSLDLILVFRGAVIYWSNMDISWTGVAIVVVLLALYFYGIMSPQHVKPNPPKRRVKKIQSIEQKEEIKEQVIHFVMPPLPPGVLSGPDRPITAAVVRTTDQNGKHGTKVTCYAGSDVFTMYEANSAIYWRDQIETNKITDSQVIDWMHSVEQKTPIDYVIAAGDDVHPGEVAITCGLTEISLHYAIGYANEVFSNQAATLEWIAMERSKGAKSKRARDFENGNNLKKALCSGEIDPEFISHINASINGKPDA